MDKGGYGVCQQSALDFQSHDLTKPERHAEMVLLLSLVAKGSTQRPQGRQKSQDFVAENNVGALPPPSRFKRKQRSSQSKDHHEIRSSIRS
jgi:hypothetical protein